MQTGCITSLQSLLGRNVFLLYFTVSSNKKGRHKSQPTYIQSNCFTFDPDVLSSLSEIVQEALLLLVAPAKMLLHRGVSELKDLRKNSKTLPRGKRDSVRVD